MAEASAPPETPIDEALTRRVADLARLELTDNETTIFTQQILEVLRYVGQLQAVDVSTVEPLLHPFESETSLRPALRPPLRPGLREDEVVVSPRDPRGEGGYQVPQIL